MKKNETCIWCSIFLLRNKFHYSGAVASAATKTPKDKIQLGTVSFTLTGSNIRTYQELSQKGS
jgi:hypothetical protein